MPGPRGRALSLSQLAAQALEPGGLVRRRISCSIEKPEHGPLIGRRELFDLREPGWGLPCIAVRRVIGILLTQDPIGMAGGVNLYSYAGNNPVAYTDPFGLCPPPPGTFDPLCFAVNLSAGFGDAVTFGLTAKLRGDADAQVDKSSAEYTAGQVAGVTASAALGGAVAKTIEEGGVLATSAPARAAGRFAVRAGEDLLGTGGKLNTGGVLRIGVGKLGQGTGRAVFRVAGSAVKAVAGAEHINLVDLGRLAEWF